MVVFVHQVYVLGEADSVHILSRGFLRELFHFLLRVPGEPGVKVEVCQIVQNWTPFLNAKCGMRIAESKQ
jgi:hypothetical protein